jgi:hypothetical protein
MNVARLSSAAKQFNNRENLNAEKVTDVRREKSMNKNIDKLLTE